jgi:hypothetical protein
MKLLRAVKLIGRALLVEHPGGPDRQSRQRLDEPDDPWG